MYGVILPQVDWTFNILNTCSGSRLLIVDCRANGVNIGQGSSFVAPCV